MDKRLLKIIATLLAILFSFFLYFLYRKFPNFITSLFSPVDESTLEYMKVLFGSVILSGITQKIAMLIKKEKIKNICFSNFIGALTSIPIFLLIFVPTSYLLGQSFILKIVVTFIAIVFAEVVSYLIMNKRDFKMENKTIFFVIAFYAIYAVITKFH